MSSDATHAPLDLSAVQPATDASRRLVVRVALPLVVLGVLLCVVALAGDRSRLAFGYLLGVGFAWTVAMGCLFFIAMHRLTHAVWSVVFRRTLECFASALPLVALLFIPVLLLSSTLYEWRDAAQVAADPILQGKAPYLNFPFFAGRAASLRAEARRDAARPWRPLHEPLPPPHAKHTPDCTPPIAYHWKRPVP